MVRKNGNKMGSQRKALRANRMARMSGDNVGYQLKGGNGRNGKNGTKPINKKKWGDKNGL